MARCLVLTCAAMLGGLACGTPFGVSNGTGGSAPQGGGEQDGQGGSGGAVAGSGGAAGTEPRADYDIVPSAGGITIDGKCNEQQWLDAPALAFQGANGTDNEVDCRFVWQEGQPDAFFGCCHITDHDLRAPVNQHDADGIWNNDGVEYFVAPVPAFGPLTTKIFVTGNLTTRDAIWDGFEDTRWEANIELGRTLIDDFDNQADDKWYVMEWRADLLVDLAGETTSYCNFMLNDNDDGSRATWLAFGNGINRPAGFGTCKFVTF